MLVLANVAFALFPQAFEPLEHQTTDRLFDLRSSIPALAPDYDGSVVHVDLDDRSLRELGTYYLGRVEHAELVRALSRAQVRAQLHDVIFAAPQPGAGDEELVAETEAAGHAYYGMALGLGRGDLAGEPPDEATTATLASQRWHLADTRGDAALPAASRPFVTMAPLASAAAGLGFLDVEADRDGVQRRLPLLAREGDGVQPAMALRIACDVLGVTPERIEVRGGRRLVLRGATVPGRDRPSDVVIPIDRQGRMIVNYVGPWERMQHYSASTVLEAAGDRFMMEDLRGELAGKLAVVSWVATGSGDIGTVPTDPVYPLSGVHANALHTILRGDFLRQLTLVEMALFVELPLLALLFLASVRLRTVPFLGAAIALVVSYALAAAWAFLRGGLILDIPGPVMVLVAGTLAVASWHYHLEARERAVLRTTLDAYFPPAVVDKVLRHGSGLLHAAQKKELTILFSDIKGFTGHTATMEAGHVRTLLNEYFERMIEVVFEHGGTLDKFIGDGLLVFCGDPLAQPDHAERAVQMALGMQREARRLADDWKRRGEMPLMIRIGINTGDVVVGNMGSERKLSYTVLGEPVNLAQRLESNAPPGGILVSQRTRELLPATLPVRAHPPIQAKGFASPVPVWEIPVE